MSRISKSIVSALCFMAASAVFAAEMPVYEETGAFKKAPASVGQKDVVVAPTPAPAPEVAVTVTKEAPKPVAPKATSACGLEVVAVSTAAVGQPCETTADVMKQLGLTKAQQRKVATLEKGLKTKTKTKTAHH
jgi:hypothetical protein